MQLAVSRTDPSDSPENRRRRTYVREEYNSKRHKRRSTRPHFGREPLYIGGRVDGPGRARARGTMDDGVNGWRTTITANI